MEALAHFLQFISFSIGLLTIYIGIQTVKQLKIKALKKYLFFLIGVNLIVFIHVFEAFSKIIFEKEFVDQYTRPVFVWISFLLSFVRLYMASLFVSFCRELIGKCKNSIFTKIAIGFFVVFFIWILFLYYTPKNMYVIGSVSLWSIHLILSSSLIYGAISLLRNSQKIKSIKNYKLFSSFIIIYALTLLFARTLNTAIILASEHFQMVCLGIITLSFNLVNIFAFKKFFQKDEESFLENNVIDSAIELYAKYSITEREQEIIKLICEGKTNKEIGEILFISHLTVRDHNSNIFSKTNVKNRTQLARIFHMYYK